MGAVTLAGAVIALASLVLLVVIERRLAAAAARPRNAAPAPRVVSAEQAWERKLQVVERRLDDLLQAIERVERPLVGRAAVPAAPPPAPAGPVAPPPPAIAAPPAPEPALSPFFAKAETAPPPSDAVSTKPWPAPPPPAPPAAEAAPTPDPDALLADYRQLVASSGRADINRWIDAHDGRACEVGEGDAIRMLERDGNALLALLPLSAEHGLVVPSGRMVANFATSYADGLSVRPTLRGGFELEADGSGQLRLIVPAFARLADGRWRIDQPGRLAGFASA